eukprot:TRINITY_DN1326_c0_g1_i1.p1 TRINITY_DN1326_c0_g1~~TRINITY_DN1326_c0_g1_i1.p1  ORF type:complete len:365 (+),score=76.50 TRINITY_DN1326_c0_g1_i1:22-1116(+)
MLFKHNFEFDRIPGHVFGSNRLCWLKENNGILVNEKSIYLLSHEDLKPSQRKVSIDILKNLKSRDLNISLNLIDTVNFNEDICFISCQSYPNHSQTTLVGVVSSLGEIKVIEIENNKDLKFDNIVFEGYIDDVYLATQCCVSFHPENYGSFIISCELSNSIHIFENFEHNKQINCFYHPKQVQFLSDKIVSIENNCIILYDPKSSRLLGRTSIGGETLSTLCCTEQFIAVGTDSRSVYVYDSKGLIIRGHVKKITKYSITQLEFSVVSDEILLICSESAEVTAAIWPQKLKKNANNFIKTKIDGPVIGLAHDQITDSLIMLSNQGGVYILQNPSLLANIEDNVTDESKHEQENIVKKNKRTPQL